MAKRGYETKRTTTSATTSTPPGASTGDAMEQRVVAFAEQLGRIAGTLLGKAEGWMHRDTLTRQIARVRDGAAGLLEHLEGKAPPTKRVAERGRKLGRSGGKVDAPGKKHRKPVPSSASASMEDSQAAKMRAARTMVKTNRRRGRG